MIGEQRSCPVPEQSIPWTWSHQQANLWSHRVALRPVGIPVSWVVHILDAWKIRPSLQLVLTRMAMTISHIRVAWGPTRIAVVDRKASWVSQTRVPLGSHCSNVVQVSGLTVYTLDHTSSSSGYMTKVKKKAHYWGFSAWQSVLGLESELLGSRPAPWAKLFYFSL